MDYFFVPDKMSYVMNRKPEGCILCLIRDGSQNIVDLSVWRDDLFIVSINLYPYNPGHLMIFPKRHLEDVRAFTEEEVIRLNALTGMCLTALDRTHAPSAYNVGYNMGLDAGASIRHLHLHIIPRYPHELGIADILGGKRVLVETPAATAEKIRKALSEISSGGTSGNTEQS